MTLENEINIQVRLQYDRTTEVQVNMSVQLRSAFKKKKPLEFENSNWDTDNAIEIQISLQCLRLILSLP